MKKPLQLLSFLLVLCLVCASFLPQLVEAKSVQNNGKSHKQQEENIQEDIDDANIQQKPGKGNGRKKTSPSQDPLEEPPLSPPDEAPALDDPPDVEPIIEEPPLTESPGTLPPKEDDGSLMIFGYYTKYWETDRGAYSSLSNYHSYMNAIGTVAYHLLADGTISGFSTQEVRDLANQSSVDANPTIQNGFDPVLTHTVLSSTSLRQKTIEAMYTLIRTHGYKGVNINFENMYASDRTSFNMFLKELSDVFKPAGLTVIVSVPAKTCDCPSWAWSGTFEYKTVAQYADFIQIMTYDQHGSWGSPGPVAGYDWVKRVLDYATAEMPSEKLLIGLPAYGYDWNISTGTGHRALGWTAIHNLLASSGTQSQWDPVSQSPYFTYTDANGHQRMVWHENATSIKLKTELVKAYQLGGVSMWRMGLENEAFWQAVQQGLE
jgi:spore germination protein YaaH